MSKYKRCQILFTISLIFFLAVFGIKYLTEFINADSSILSTIKIVFFIIAEIAQIIFICETYNLDKFSKITNSLTIIIKAILIIPIIIMFNENKEVLFILIPINMVYLMLMPAVAVNIELDLSDVLRSR